MHTTKDQFDIPILMLVFRRPIETKRVLDRILEMHPKRLYIVADGAREDRPDDVAEVYKTRALFKDLPSSIKVTTLFRDKNLGLRKSVESGLSWFFSKEKMGIILEDDCLPSYSFFEFMRTNLIQYEKDEKVMHIGGDNYQFGKKYGEKGADYYFSHLPHIWGWATWKRAWKHYDPNAEKVKSFLQTKKASDFGIEWFYFHKHKEYFKKTIISHTLDSWAYIWHFSIWYNKGISICPNVNLVQNIGFGENATHTTSSESILASVQAKEIELPIKHPKNIIIQHEADNHALGVLYGKNWGERLMRRLRRWIA